MKTFNHKSLMARFLSGFLSVLMIISACPSTITAFASGTDDDTSAVYSEVDEDVDSDDVEDEVDVDSDDVEDEADDTDIDNEDIDKDDESENADTDNNSDINDNSDDDKSDANADDADDKSDNTDNAKTDDKTDAEDKIEAEDEIKEAEPVYEYSVVLPNDTSTNVGTEINIKAETTATKTIDDETEDVDYTLEFSVEGDDADISVKDDEATIIFNEAGDYTVICKMIVDDEEVSSDEMTISVVEEELPLVEFDHYFTDIDESLVETSDLLVKTSDASIFTKNTNVVSNFDDVYIIECSSVEEARYVYSYYVDKVDSISDLSKVISIATDDNADDVADLDDLNDGNDALAQLNEEVENTEKTDYSDYIALIDTGANADANFSVVGDDTADSEGHGTDMLNLIRNENPDAKVMSIKVFNGSRTDAASVYAGIKLAIENDVRIINLSLVGSDVEKNAIVKEAIQEAIDKGIIVIGAAGNYNLSATKFIPGCIEDVIVVGAATEDGTKLIISNYDADYYVVANSSSAATAIFTGIYSKIDSLDELDDSRVFDFELQSVYKDLTDEELYELFGTNIIIRRDENGRLLCIDYPIDSDDFEIAASRHAWTDETNTYTITYEEMQFIVDNFAENKSMDSTNKYVISASGSTGGILNAVPTHQYVIASAKLSWGGINHSASNQDLIEYLYTQCNSTKNILDLRAECEGRTDSLHPSPLFKSDNAIGWGRGVPNGKVVYKGNWVLTSSPKIDAATGIQAVDADGNLIFDYSISLDNLFICSDDDYPGDILYDDGATTTAADRALAEAKSAGTNLNALFRDRNWDRDVKINFGIYIKPLNQYNLYDVYLKNITISYENNSGSLVREKVFDETQDGSKLLTRARLENDNVKNTMCQSTATAVKNELNTALKSTLENCGFMLSCKDVVSADTVYDAISDQFEAQFDNLTAGQISTAYVYGTINAPAKGTTDSQVYLSRLYLNTTGTPTHNTHEPPESDAELIGFDIQKCDTYYTNTTEGDSSWEGIKFALVFTEAVSYPDEKPDPFPVAPAPIPTPSAQSGDPIEVDGSDYSVGQVVWIGTTDANGYIECPEIIPLGKYELHELPRGSSVVLGDTWADISDEIYANDSMQWNDTTWELDFECTNIPCWSDEASYTSSFNGGNLYGQQYSDDTVLGNIHIQKYDLENDENEPYTQGDNLLTNIQFAIVNRSANPVRYPYEASGDDYQPGMIVAIVSTDEYGEAECNGLPYGTYDVYELRRDHTWEEGDTWDDDSSSNGVSNYANAWYCYNDSMSNVTISNESRNETSVTYTVSSNPQSAAVREQDVTEDVDFSDLPIRSDLYFAKADENGNIMPYTPFLVSLVEVVTDEDGNTVYTDNVDANGHKIPAIKTTDGLDTSYPESNGEYKVIEQHVIVTDAFGVVDTRDWTNRPSTPGNVNQLDTCYNGLNYTGTLQQLYDAAGQNIWFGDVESGYTVNKRGSLLAGTYIVQELNRDVDNSNLAETTDAEIESIFGAFANPARQTEVNGELVTVYKYTMTRNTETGVWEKTLNSNYPASGKLMAIAVPTTPHGASSEGFAIVQIDNPVYDFRMRVFQVTHDNVIYYAGPHDNTNSLHLNHPITITSVAQDTTTETNSTTLSETDLLNDTASFDNLFFDSKYKFVTHIYRVQYADDGTKTITELDESKPNGAREVELDFTNAPTKTDPNGRQYTALKQPDGSYLMDPDNPSEYYWMSNNIALIYDKDDAGNWSFRVDPVLAPASQDGNSPFDRLTNISIQNFFTVDSKSQCDYGDDIAFTVDLYQWSPTVGWILVNTHNKDCVEESQNIHIVRIDTLVNNKTTDTRVASLGGYAYDDRDSNYPLVDNASITGNLVYNEDGEIVGYTLVDDSITYKNFAHNHYYNFKAFLVDKNNNVVKDIYGNNCETDLLYLYIDRNLTEVINGMNINPEYEDYQKDENGEYILDQFGNKIPLNRPQLSIEGPCSGSFKFSTFGLTDWVIPNFPNDSDSVHMRVIFYDTRGQVNISHNADLSIEDEAIRYLRIETTAKSEEEVQGTLTTHKYWDDNGIVHYDASTLYDDIHYWNLAEPVQARIEGYVYLVGYDEDGNRFIDTDNGRDTVYVAHSERIVTLDQTTESYTKNGEADAGGTVRMTYTIPEAGRYEERELVVCERVYMDVDGYCTQQPVEVTMRRLNDTHGDSLHPTYTMGTETYQVYVMDKDGVNDSEVLIALHEDINDEMQTVRVPKIETHLVNVHDGIDYKVVSRELADVTLVDSVSYNNLKVGDTWDITATLMDQKTGNPVTDENGNDVVSYVTLKANADGTVDIIAAHSENADADFDATVDNARLINGGAYGVVNIKITFKQVLKNIDWTYDPSWVCFETLRHGEHGTSNFEYAVHNNIYDERQTVHRPVFRTTISSNGENREHVILAEPDQTVTDTVAIKNVSLDTILDENGKITGFVPQTFTLQIEALDYENGTPILDASGNPYVNTKTFELSGRLNDDGTVTALVDGEAIPGQVLFEKHSDKGTGNLTGYGAVYTDFYIVNFGSEASPLLVDIDLTLDGSLLKGRTILFGETLYFGDSTNTDDKVIREHFDNDIENLYPENHDDNPDNDTDVRIPEDIAEQWAVVPDIHTNVFDPNLYDPTTYNWDPTSEVATGDGKNLQIVVNGNDEWYINGQKTENYELKVVDEISLINVIPDRNYTIVTKLIDKETGEFVKWADNSGDYELRTTYISPKSTTDAGRATSVAISETTCGCYRPDCVGVIAVTDTLRYDADPTQNRAIIMDLANTKARYGGTFTVYEYIILNSNPNEIYAYDNVMDGSVNDINETMYMPQIKTMFTDDSTHAHVVEMGKDVELTDKVSYRNLKPNTKYTMYCILMTKDGRPLLDENGNTYEANYTFTTPDATNPGDLFVNGDTNDFHFTVKSEVIERFVAAGNEIVAFEKLELTATGELVAIHTDLTDKDQTIYIPHIRTTAWDTKDGDKYVSIKSGTASITDTVYYTDLSVDHSYTLRASLKYPDTGEPVLDGNGNPITATKTFTPETVNGFVNVVFNFNTAGAPELEEKTVVVFEELYYSNFKIATHTELNDVNQQVKFTETPPPKPPTPSSPPDTPPTPPTPPEVPYSLILHVSIIKCDFDHHEYKLKNAEISIFKDAACTEVATDIYGNPCVGMTDANGYVDFYINATSPDSIFYAKETKAPFGYKICTDVLKVVPTAERDANNMCPITLQMFDKIIIIPPKTGDNFPILFIALLALMGIFCIAAFFATNKKTTKSTASNTDEVEEVVEEEEDTESITGLTAEEIDGDSHNDSGF